MPGSTSYPTALDAGIDVNASTPENQPGAFHDVNHNNSWAAIKALQTFVGTSNGAIAGSVAAVVIDHEQRIDDAEADIALLESGKADAGHGHAIAGVSGLQTALDGKAASSHAHAAGDITSGTFADARIAASNVTQHAGALAIGWGQLTGSPPALLVTEVYTVANEAAQLALTADEGDIAIRTDESKSYAHNGGTAGTMADWSLLQTPTGAVLSVNGQTGVVVLAAADVGAATDDHGHVAATSEAAGFMPAADKSKLDGIATAATANAADAALRDRATHTGEQAISTVTGLQTALDGKEASGAVTTHNADTSAHGQTTAGSALVTLANPAALIWISVNTNGTLNTRTASETLADIGAAAASHGHAWGAITGTPTTLAGYGITDGQPLDATLTALAALDSTAGLLVQTGADAFARRTLAAPGAGITITNPAGTAGNPTFVLADDLAAVEGLAATGLVRRTAANTWSAGTTVATAEIADNAVTDSKLRDSAALTVIGRSVNSTGDPTDIAAGTDHQVLRRSGTTLAFGAVALAQSAAVTGILGSANGGTENGFTAFSGPATSAKTFTLPNASATILTTNAAVTVAQGGSGATTLTGWLKGNGTGAFTGNATIPSTDISGLGTMATQNANAVAITGGTINGTAIGGTTPAAVAATTGNFNNIVTSTHGGSGGTDSAFVASHSSGPKFAWNVSGQGADGKMWDALAASNTWSLRTVNDAINVAATALRVTRSGNTITQVEQIIGGTTRSLTNSSGVTVTGNITIPVGNAFTSYTENYGFGTPNSDGLQIFCGAGDRIRFGSRDSGTFTQFGQWTAGALAVNGAITTTGNVGIGVAPSAWFPGVYAVIDVGAASAFGGYVVGASGDELSFMTTNAFFNSSNTPIYKATGLAANYRQFNGVHQFFTAPSGTAGDVATFTQNCTIDSAGLAVTGAISATTTVTTGVYTVATLPAGANGSRAFVTDANSTTFAAAVAGGGANGVPVYYGSGAWRIG